MFDGQLIVSAGALSTVSIEAVKWVVRKYIKKDFNYSFPTIYYDLVLPFFTALYTVLLGAIGWAEPVVFDWNVFLQWFVTIIVTLALYHLGVQPTVRSREEARYENG